MADVSKLYPKRFPYVTVGELRHALDAFNADLPVFGLADGGKTLVGFDDASLTTVPFADPSIGAYVPRRAVSIDIHLTPMPDLTKPLTSTEVPKSKT